MRAAGKGTGGLTLWVFSKLDALEPLKARASHEVGSPRLSAF